MNACRHIDKLLDSAKWAGQRGREEKGKGKGEGGIDCDTATVIYAERQDESEER